MTGTQGALAGLGAVRSRLGSRPLAADATLTALIFALTLPRVLDSPPPLA